MVHVAAVLEMTPSAGSSARTCWNIPNVARGCVVTVAVVEQMSVVPATPLHESKSRSPVISYSLVKGWFATAPERRRMSHEMR